MKLAIIAGGKGTRLGLQDIPKPMVKLADAPLLEHQINLAKRYGITDIYILSGHLANVIFDYFKNGAEFGVNITHLIEPYPLGTAGSVKLLEHLIHERFLVFYGDVAMDFNIRHFMDFDQDKKSIATILVHPNDHPYDSDLVEIDKDKNVLAFHSKPYIDGQYYTNLVNAAVYILSPEIFREIPFGIPTDFGKNIFPKLIMRHKISAYKSSEYIKDLGTINRLEKVTRDYLEGKIARLNKSNKRNAIFLDRDGVINKDTNNLSSIGDFELLEKVPEAIRNINASDFLAIVITNQPMIAKGFMSEQDLYSIHQKMEYLLGKENAYIDDIYYCPHHPEAGFPGEIKEFKFKCRCRKPEPGMILEAAQDYNIDLANSWMIGDREADITAGKKAGCKTILINENSELRYDADKVCVNLITAVNFIIKRRIK